jgi:hypothetical protein
VHFNQTKWDPMLDFSLIVATWCIVLGIKENINQKKNIVLMTYWTASSNIVLMPTCKCAENK